MIKKILFLAVIFLMSFPKITSSCTIIVVGKKASIDCSVIVSQTDCGDDCRIRVIPRMDFPKGLKASVFWGIQRIDLALENYGEVIGYIPQVEHTYQYFHSAYSHMNEHQLAIAESTTSMRRELKIKREESKQIMTIEQAMIFALQRYTNAKEATQFIGELMSKYGFLPSCVDESETIVIADPEEAWVFEVVAVGPEWEPKSGKPGAIWVAQRLPEDKASIIPNWLTIKEINPKDKDNFMYSSNYKSFAIEKGWYNPKDTFIWQDIYAPTPREWATDRFWLFYSTIAPNLKEWPKRISKNPYSGLNDYVQYVEPLSMYPFAVKTEKKISIKDVMAFQRSFFEGTIYDMSNDPDWYVPNEKGKMTKSPIATPFPTRDMRKLMDINNRRNVARGGYGMIAQLRSWLPDPIGGIYWVYQDNQTIGMYFPLYCGIKHVNEKLKNYDPTKYNPNSAKWAIDFVDNLLYLKWQDAYKDLLAERTPLEEEIFENMKLIDDKAKKLYKENPDKAKDLLTDFSSNTTNQIHKFYSEFRIKLLVKYTNNKQGIIFQ